jgi:Cd2+/Zn2+-exporting ATPase
MSQHNHTHGGDSLCCNANVEEEIALDSQAKEELTTVLHVQGMDCADEVEALRRVLTPIAGLRDFRVNLMGGTVTVSHERRIGTAKLIQAISRAGLKANLPSERSPSEDESISAQRVRMLLVGTSGLASGLGYWLDWAGGWAPWVPVTAFCIAIISGGWFVAPKALRSLRQGSLDMNVLMSVAVLGAVAIGQWSEGAAVVFLFGLSELLEAFSLNRARRAVQSLLRLAPETALVKREGVLLEIPVKEVTPGDFVTVRSGAKVPLDGEVVSGESFIDQAPITGESIPVEKKPGDAVFAGTINGDGSLEIKVTRAFSDTTLSKIIKLVGEAQSTKAPSQNFVDRFARIYTPAVFAGAILVLLTGPLVLGEAWFPWIYRALVLLVIACPCALVISTPVSIVSGLTAMAHRGVLIKGGTFLEQVGGLEALAMDKTGTITEGKPNVTKIHLLNASSAQEMLRIAAAIDIHSDHPVAQAVLRYAEAQKVEFPSAEKYQARNGRGAEAWLEGHQYFVGNHRFAHELGVCTPELEAVLEEMETQAQSVVVVGHKPHDDHAGQVLGVIAVGDTLRPHVAEAIRALHQAGIKKIIMLSGDNQRTVDAIAREVGIDEARGGLLPEEKVEAIKALMLDYKSVGMVGDGVNDAPAMAVATLGIAMGAGGTDTAIETADIALMKDDLAAIAQAVTLGRRTLRTIQVNIGFAVIVKVVFLTLALAGRGSLWLAILADTGATLLVIFNALRLLR